MPQNGFHGLVGLGVARIVAPRLAREDALPFVSGVTLGAMLPDIDMYPTAIVFLMGRDDLIYVMHRTATHSVFLVLLLAVAGLSAMLLVPRRPRSSSSAAIWVCWGLAAGIATHAALDTFFWFAQIDLFWPLSHLPPQRPLLPVLNLWEGARPATLLVNLREAFEFAAFALLLRALHRIASTSQERVHSVSLGSLKRWEKAAWIGFVVALVGAVVFQHTPKFQNVLVTAPYLLAFLPYCWLMVYRLRMPITRWARGETCL